MNVHVTKPEPTVTIELSLPEAHQLRSVLAGSSLLSELYWELVAQLSAE